MRTRGLKTASGTLKSLLSYTPWKTKIALQGVLIWGMVADLSLTSSPYWHKNRSPLGYDCPMSPLITAVGVDARGATISAPEI